MKQSLQEAFADFAKNERWGTCGWCPRDGNGVPHPEFCDSTKRYDHNLTGYQLIEAYHNYKGDKKPPAEPTGDPPAFCSACAGSDVDYGRCGVCGGGKNNGE